MSRDFLQAKSQHLVAVLFCIALLLSGCGAGISGQGAGENEAEAVKWWRKAAEQGNAQAQWNFGAMYADGQGVPRDYREAVRWWRMAAEQGEAKAQFNLGVMYQRGWGVAKDDAEAVRWWRKAAEQGDARAQNNLEWMRQNSLSARQAAQRQENKDFAAANDESVQTMKESLRPSPLPAPARQIPQNTKQKGHVRQTLPAKKKAPPPAQSQPSPEQEQRQKSGDIHKDQQTPGGKQEAIAERTKKELELADLYHIDDDNSIRRKRDAMERADER